MTNLGIEIGKVYDYFDDGKITPSRKSTVIITDIISANDIDDITCSQWLNEFDGRGDISHWLYAKETDYFIKGNIIINRITGENTEITFVRTIDGGWFSLGWWAGRLDVDGSLQKLLDEKIEYYKS